MKTYELSDFFPSELLNNEQIKEDTVIQVTKQYYNKPYIGKLKAKLEVEQALEQYSSDDMLSDNNTIYRVCN